MVGAPSERNVRVELSLEIVADAQRASTEFWKAWLWQSRETRTAPSAEFCTTLSTRFGVPSDDVQQLWLEWYGFLTSWDLAATLAGCDVRVMPPIYGASHRRA